MAGKLSSANAQSLLDEVNEYLHEQGVVVDSIPGDYDPLKHMTVMAAQAAANNLPAHLQFAMAKEVAPYYYAKKKSVEVEGIDGGPQIMLISFSDAQEQGLVKQQPQAIEVDN